MKVAPGRRPVCHDPVLEPWERGDAGSLAGDLKESYAVANSGKEFKMPEGISTVEQSTAHVLKQIEKARASLKQGKTGESARLLLEAALMIVTPMDARR